MTQKPQQQEVPGVQSEMDPVPDCGEETRPVVARFNSSAVTAPYL